MEEHVFELQNNFLDNEWEWTCPTCEVWRTSFDSMDLAADDAKKYHEDKS